MFKYNKTVLSVAIASTLFAGQVLSADRINLEEKNTIASQKINLQALLTPPADITKNSVFSAASSSRRLSLPGAPKVKLLQFYKGVEVYSVSAAANQNDDSIFVNVTGEFIAGIENDLNSVVPTITAEDALNTAFGESEKFIVKTDVYNVESKLYVWLDAKDIAHLAWFVSYVEASATPSRPHLFIDAHSGEVLDQWEGMTFADGTGSGGNQRTGRYSFGPNSKYPAFEVTGGGSSCKLDSKNVITYDMNHRKSGGSVHTFPCYENTSRAVNGSYSALNDAHAFGQVTFNMFKEWYGAAPLTQKLKMRVHYDRDFENAFWDGQQMTFGDGKNTFHPLVGLGVVAHEVSHGFTQQNSNLVYRNQSGGLNESFSDISAAAASYYLNGSFSWQIGDTIKKGSGAMRYMDSPTRDGRSIDHVRNYKNGIDVHLSSGIYNKAFHALSTTSNWNIRKAFDVYVEANQTYWTANSTFSSAGKGVYNAAKSLGYCVNDVVASLESVGVTGSGVKDGTNCGDTGLNLPPTSNFTFSVNKLAVAFTDKSNDDKAVVSYNWAFGDGASSSAKNPTHNYATKGSYSVSLTVSDKEGLTAKHNATVKVDDGVIVDPGKCTAKAWSASTIYLNGDKASQNGKEYKANWWSRNQSPAANSGRWQVWSFVADCK